MPLRPTATIEFMNSRTGKNLPGLFGVLVTALSEGRLVMHCTIRPEFLAPNGYLHAAAVIAIADTAAGYATIAHLPEGATNFTTIELKSNFLGTATEGTVRAEATVAHAGKTTQVWDALVTHVETGRTLALFRCTQLILWPKEPTAVRLLSFTQMVDNHLGHDAPLSPCGRGVGGEGAERSVCHSFT